MRDSLGKTPLPDRRRTTRTDSARCAPSIASQGAASVSIGSNVTFVAASALETMDELPIRSLTPAATPFGGGTRCPGSPVQRTSVLVAGTAAQGSHPCRGICS